MIVREVMEVREVREVGDPCTSGWVGVVSMGFVSFLPPIVGSRIFPLDSAFISAFDLSLEGFSSFLHGCNPCTSSWVFIGFLACHG